MPMMAYSESIGANSQVRNVFSGEDYEYADRPYVGSLYITGSAAGLEYMLTIGGNVIVPVGTKASAANRIPQKDDLVVPEIEIPPGAHIVLFAQNTTAGALTFNARLELDNARIV